MSKISGNRPTILIVDEMQAFRLADYAKLEERLLSQGYGLIRTALSDEGDISQEYLGVGDVVVIGGGRGYSHPQMDQIPTGRRAHFNPQFQELPGVKEEHAKAWGELLHRAFDTPEARQRFKEMTFLDRHSMPGMRGSGKTLSVLRDHAVKAGFPEFCRLESVGADHPSRKREPKGPRGKWGKL